MCCLLVCSIKENFIKNRKKQPKKHIRASLKAQFSSTSSGWSSPLLPLCPLALPPPSMPPLPPPPPPHPSQDPSISRLLPLCCTTGTLILFHFACFFPPIFLIAPLRTGTCWNSWKFVGSQTFATWNSAITNHEKCSTLCKLCLSMGVWYSVCLGKQVCVYVCLCACVCVCVCTCTRAYVWARAHNMYMCISMLCFWPLETIIIWFCEFVIYFVCLACMWKALDQSSHFIIHCLWQRLPVFSILVYKNFIVSGLA